MALKTSRETGNTWHSRLPEKLATYGTQDVEEQNKNTTQYVFDIAIQVCHFDTSLFMFQQDDDICGVETEMI